MKKISQNTFNKGLNLDLNPLSTPKDVLTDCVNGTIITYNGDEFCLQTDQGNVRVSTEFDYAKLPENFIPLGMKEYNGVMYIIAHNPITKETQVGSLPSPKRYVTFDSESGQIYKTMAKLQSDSKNLTSTISINHNMNLLNAYITSGDKFIVSIDLQNGGDDNFSVLKKLINKYEEVSDQGYFTFEYFTMDSSGNLTPVNLSLVNDVKYPSNSIDKPGNKLVYTQTSKGVISLVIKAVTIELFDFTISPIIDNDILKGKIMISPDPLYIDDSNSAIKLKTIKIEYRANEEGIIATGTKYFTYVGELDYLYIDKTPESFSDGTILTVTCTPIDQFGRELIDKSKTRTTVLTKIPSSISAHNYFRYTTDESKTSITLIYDFLYKGPDPDNNPITKTRIEFYDFWSDITFITGEIDFISGTENGSRQCTYTIDLANRIQNSQSDQFFDQYNSGGIPYTMWKNYDGPFHVFGAQSPKREYNFTGNPFLRKDHCYIVRIFGVDNNNIEYSIIQLLYTNGVFNTQTANNFGSLDLVTMLGTNTYTFQTSKSGIFTIPYSQTYTGNINYTNQSYNYISSSRGPETYNEVYRIYGGPVKCERLPNDSDTVFVDYIGAEGTRYRNAYDKKFYSSLGDIGYHNISEAAIRAGILPSSSYYIQNDSSIINDSAMITGGLIKAGLNKNFNFEVLIDYTSVFNNISGSLSLTSTKLFGIVDNTLFTKKVTLKGEEICNATSFSGNKTYSTTKSFIWSGSTPSFSASESLGLNINFSTSQLIDTYNIQNISSNIQRFISGISKFYYAPVNLYKYKTLEYYSWDYAPFIKVSKKALSDTSWYNMETYDNAASTDSEIIKWEGGTQIYTVSPGYVYSDRSGSYTKDLSYRTEIKIPGQTVKIKLYVNPNQTYPNSNGDRNDMREVPLRVGITDAYISPLGTYQEYRGVGMDSTKRVVLAKTMDPENQTLQNIYYQALTPHPFHFDISVGPLNDGRLVSNSSLLYCYIGSNTYEYVAFPYPQSLAEWTSNSQTFQSKVCIKYPYKEILLTQYPDPSETTYTLDTSSSSVNLTSNKVEYYTPTLTDIYSKYLTLYCEGSGGLKQFNINNIKSIINGKWLGVSLTEGSVNTSIDTVKVVYNFMDNVLSIGDQKNIPYNFRGNVKSTTAVIPDINFITSIGVPSQTISNFVGALDNAKANYVKDDLGSVPQIRVCDSSNNIRIANGRIGYNFDLSSNLIPYIDITGDWSDSTEISELDPEWWIYHSSYGHIDGIDLHNFYL